MMHIKVMGKDIARCDDELEEDPRNWTLFPLYSDCIPCLEHTRDSMHLKSNKDSIQRMLDKVTA